MKKRLGSFAETDCGGGRNTSPAVDRYYYALKSIADAVEIIKF
jgi:hypothetical protein